MLIKTEKNWKRYLNIDDEAIINKIIQDTAKYRAAYKNADEVKIAQIWCTFIEMEKKIQRIESRLRRIEFIFEGLAKRIEEDRETLLKSLNRF